MEKERGLNSLKFGIAGALVSGLVVLISDIILWMTAVPWYNSVMINVYGAAGISFLGVLKALFVSVIVALIFGFVVTWIFAWVYNKLLMIKVK